MHETCALLQIDIVDSTRLAQRLGDTAASALWQAHDRAARDLLAVSHGREIDKSDGFLLLFAKVADAVDYAVAYHRAIAALELPSGVVVQARAGLHTGAVITRENPVADVARGAKPLEVEGVAKPTTARVMTMARPGQTLMSADARAAWAAAPSLGPLRLQSHGHWRLKGLAEPLEVFEVGDADAPFEPPQDSEKAYRVVQREGLWLPAREVRHSLPAERDAFVDRRDHLHDLGRRLEAGARLVSIFGMGGMGKTRFAQRFGWIWLGDYPGGVWFCDLSEAISLDGVLHSVGQGLDVPLAAGDPVVQLGNAIAGRGKCLVVLDNFERVAEFAEQTLGRWLDRARDAKFIVTTREVLGIQGEQAMEMTPLGVAEGVELFERRVSAVLPEYLNSPVDPLVLPRLVGLLDGLPLAIELAAARARVMPPDELLHRMRERFKLLVPDGRRAQHQATLEATLDWSWDVLSQAERMTLVQLSVFDGGFTLAAAEAIVRTQPADAHVGIAGVIQALVDKSLVRHTGRVRFGLLVTVRDYVRLRAQAGGEDTLLVRDSAFERHRKYYSTLSELDAFSGDQSEIENIVSACRCAVDADDNGSAIHAVVLAWSVLKLRGPFRLAMSLVAHVRQLANLSEADKAALLWIEGSAFSLLGRRNEAAQQLAIGVEAARRSGALDTEAQLLCSQAELVMNGGEFDRARELLHQALQITGFGERESSLSIKVHNTLGIVHFSKGEIERAVSHYRLGLEIAQRLGDERWQGGILGNLGCLYHGNSELNLAKNYFESALKLSQAYGTRQWEGNTRCNLGLVLHELGLADEARTELTLALEIAREIGYLQLELTLLINLGMVDESENKFEAACVNFAEAASKASAIGVVPLEIQALSYLGLSHARCSRAEAMGSCFTAVEGLTSRLSDRNLLALVHCHEAHAEALCGDAAAAILAGERAEHSVRSLGSHRSADLSLAYEQMREALSKVRRTWTAANNHGRRFSDHP
jgi:predicted ATPase/class 3 adenylate cyclase/Tfp pilus assembly protein PilF